MANLRPTYLEIDIDNFLHNINIVRSFIGSHTKIMTILKGNAYGHGFMKLAGEAIKNHVDIIGVGILEEGIYLREHGVKTSILVLSGVYGDQVYDLVRHGLSTIVFSRESLIQIEKAAKSMERLVHIHLKVDTGMGRLGFSPEDVTDVYSFTSDLRNIKIIGLMTHFAGSYMMDESITLDQISKFNNLIVELENNNIRPEFIHAANSAAIIKYPGSHYNMVRPGIMLYGISPFSNNEPPVSLKPVMTWKTKIIDIKKINKGGGVSYGHYYKTNRDSLIGVLPLGYGDGYSRIISDKASVIVNGRKVRQVGKICMDLSMIDITGLKNVNVGDEVIIMGKSDNGTEISAFDLANWLNTIPYEILCMIGSRVPRIYIKNGERY